MKTKTLGTEYTELNERKLFLKDNCDAVETMGYMKQFDPEQISQMKNDLSEISIEINDIEEEKKAASALFKIQLDPLNEQRKELLKGIKEKAEYVKETVYKFIDHDTRTVEYFNDQGHLVSTRPATADEMQKTIFQIDRTGTNN